MGFNTTVVILNDAIHVIEKDPEFGRRLAEAIREQWGTGKPVYVFAASGRGSSSAAVVIEQHHADQQVLVGVGGNTGKVIHSRIRPRRDGGEGRE